MNLQKIQNRISYLCPYIKEIVVIVHNNYPFAIIYPNFEVLKSSNIINIESEIRWYGVELYNMEADEQQKVRGYFISTQPLPKSIKNNFDKDAIKKLIEVQKKVQTQEEPKDELYQVLKSYISTLSNKPILLSSHLELDIGLDSLDYVELFVFIENSFNVKIDEKIFSSLMIMQDLYNYIKKNKEFIKPKKTNWETILNVEDDEELVYSPCIMSLYKIILLPIFKLLFRLEVNGVENIPTSACIIAPTHQSMLDGFLIESSLPFNILRNTFFLAFKQVFGTKLLKPISKHGQTILIDANINLMRTMQHVSLPLKKGHNLVIFPEGARTRDGKLLEFRPFFAMLSKTHNLPIIPVVIDGSYEALASGKIFPRLKKIKITYLKPVLAQDKSFEEITKLVKSSIEKEIQIN